MLGVVVQVMLRQNYLRSSEQLGCIENRDFNVSISSSRVLISLSTILDRRSSIFSSPSAASGSPSAAAPERGSPSAASPELFNAIITAWLYRERSVRTSAAANWKCVTQCRCQLGVCDPVSLPIYDK